MLFCKLQIKVGICTLGDFTIWTCIRVWIATLKKKSISLPQTILKAHLAPKIFFLAHFTPQSANFNRLWSYNITLYISHFKSIFFRTGGGDDIAYVTKYFQNLHDSLRAVLTIDIYISLMRLQHMRTMINNTKKCWDVRYNVIYHPAKFQLKLYHE